MAVCRDANAQSRRCLEDGFAKLRGDGLAIDEGLLHDDLGVKISSRKISKYWLSARGISLPNAHRLVWPIRWSKSLSCFCELAVNGPLAI